jgi:hypothetical protein
MTQQPVEAPGVAMSRLDVQQQFDVIWRAIAATDVFFRGREPIEDGEVLLLYLYNHYDKEHTIKVSVVDNPEIFKATIIHEIEIAKLLGLI